jgi:hypothetical protein
MYDPDLTEDNEFKAQLAIVQNLRPQPPSVMDNFITHLTDCMLRPNQPTIKCTK